MVNTVWSTTDLHGVTLSGGNLVATSSGSAPHGVRAADGVSSGKYYWEVTATTWNASGTALGMATASAALDINNPGSGQIYLTKSGAINLQGSATGSTLGARAAGDIIAFALDAGAQLLWMRVAPAGNWNGSGTANPATGAGGISLLTVSGLPLASLYPALLFQSNVTGDVFTANFGDSAFSGSAPSGFTSGFTAGGGTFRAVVTQAALEQWAMPNAAAQITSVAVEQWATPTGAGVQALISQVALEQWASAGTAAASVAPMCVVMA